MKKNKKNFKKQTFFRSFAISLIILFSLLTLLLGFGAAHARMEKQKTGKEKVFNAQDFIITFNLPKNI